MAGQEARWAFGCSYDSVDLFNLIEALGLLLWHTQAASNLTAARSRAFNTLLPVLKPLQGRGGIVAVDLRAGCLGDNTSKAEINLEQRPRHGAGRTPSRCAEEC